MPCCPLAALGVEEMGVGVKEEKRKEEKKESEKKLKKLKRDEKK